MWGEAKKKEDRLVQEERRGKRKPSQEEVVGLTLFRKCTCSTSTSTGMQFGPPTCMPRVKAKCR